MTTSDLNSLNLGFIPLLWDHIIVGAKGNAFQFGLVIDLKERTVYIDFEDDYVHTPSGVSYKKGHSLKRGARFYRGYLTHFCAETWIWTYPEDDHLPNIPLVVRSISDKEIHLAYPQDQENQEDFCLVTMEPDYETRYITIPGTIYRGYEPYLSMGKIVQAAMVRVFGSSYKYRP
ncbi:MAG: hypothetical protein AB7P49_00090 [Bdellovibrionales bacterium]